MNLSSAIRSFLPEPRDAEHQAAIVDGINALRGAIHDALRSVAMSGCPITALNRASEIGNDVLALENEQREVLRDMTEEASNCQTCGGSGGGPEHWRCTDCRGTGQRRLQHEPI